jgi:pantoate kinase
VWVVAFGGAVLTQWPESTPLAVLLVCGWVVSSAGALALAVTLKEAFLRGDRLVIRRRGRVAEVAAGDIREVAADYSLGAWVVVRVAPPCAFGARVSFIPPVFPPSRAGAVVAELRALATSKQAEPGAAPDPAT